MEQEKFISNKDLALYTPQRSMLTTAGHIEADMHEQETTFDLYIRELPKNRNYLIFAGLEDVVHYLMNLRFIEEDIELIQKQFNFPEKIINYFRNFKFTGTVYAMKEGTIFFPNEPIIRITGPLAQLQIIESFLFNTVGFQTLMASKISRLVHAAKPYAVGIGESRAHGLEAGLKAIRSGYIAGTNSSPLLLSFKRYGIPAIGGIATHFFVTSFPTEIEAFRAYLNVDPNGSVMVDTYNFEEGIKNAIKVARELEQKGKKMKWITIDSGDLYERYVLARKMLDEAGLDYIGLTAVSNLDEHKIKELVEKGATYNLFGAATEIVTSSDCPKIEIVYKLAEINQDGKWKPTAKFAPGKISYPGRKQIYRIKEGDYYKFDVVGLEKEEIEGEPLLQKIIVNGEFIGETPQLEQIKKYTAEQYGKFHPSLFNVSKFVEYGVNISQGVMQIVNELKKEYNVK